MDATNVTMVTGSMETNENTSVVVPTSEGNTPYSAISIAILSVIIIFCNLFFFIFYLIFGVRNVHSLLVVSLCIGNSVMGCSGLLGIIHYLNSVTIPYICSANLATVSWGFTFNIFMTFWICLERYLLIQNIPCKEVSWMERGKELIVIITGVVIAVYVAILFTAVQDNTAIICDGVNVFRNYYPFYGGLSSVLYLCLLVTIVMMYRKTLFKLSLMERRQRVRYTKTSSEVFSRKRTNNMTKHSATTDAPISSTGIVTSLQATNRLPVSTETVNDVPCFSDLTEASVDDIRLEQVDETSSQEKHRHVHKPSSSKLDVWVIKEPVYRNIRGKECKERKTSGKVTKVVDICNIKSNNSRDDDTDHEEDSENIGVSWLSKAQTTVRHIIYLVSAHCLSLVLAHIAAYFGKFQLRTFFVAITLVCILISPFMYVFRIPGVKEGIRRICCKCSAKVGMSG